MIYNELYVQSMGCNVDQSLSINPTLLLSLNINVIFYLKKII